MSDTIKSEVSDKEPRLSRRARRKARRLEREHGPQEPDTCPECGLVDDGQTSTDLLLTGGKRKSFCSAACIAAFARSEEGAAQILFRYLYKAAFSAGFDQPWIYGRECRCIQCEKGSDLKWGSIEADDEGTDEEIRELKRQVCKSCDSGAYSEADRLGRTLMELLGKRIPAYRERYLEISGGFDSLVDGTYLICSLECLIAFAEEQIPTYDESKLRFALDLLIANGTLSVDLADSMAASLLANGAIPSDITRQLGEANQVVRAAIADAVI